jgi:hypothetical protein
MLIHPRKNAGESVVMLRPAASPFGNELGRIENQEVAQRSRKRRLHEAGVSEEGRRKYAKRIDDPKMERDLREVETTPGRAFRIPTSLGNYRFGLKCNSDAGTMGIPAGRHKVLRVKSVGHPVASN